MNDLIERISRHPFVRHLKLEHLAILAGCAREVRFKAGEVLFHEGEPANQFYLLESGGEVLEACEPAGETLQVETLGSGEVLGWSWLFAPFGWHCQARVVQQTTAIVLNGAHPLVVAEEDHDFGYELMKRVAQVVIRQLQATRKLHQASAAEPEHAR